MRALAAGHRLFPFPGQGDLERCAHHFLKLVFWFQSPFLAATSAVDLPVMQPCLFHIPCPTDVRGGSDSLGFQSSFQGGEAS